MGSTPFSGVIGDPDRHVGVAGPEPVLEHAFLVGGLLDERLEALGRPPRSVSDTHDAFSTMNGLSETKNTLLGVDRDDRDARRLFPPVAVPSR